MYSLNSIRIIGRAGKDAELRTTGNGTQIVNFSVATSDKWKDKGTGQMQEKTEWHSVTAFGKTAELLGQFVRKGSMVMIEGKMQYRTYEDKDGVTKYSAQILANDFMLLDGKPGGERSESRQEMSVPEFEASNADFDAPF